MVDPPKREAPRTDSTRVVDIAFPEAADRVLPMFHVKEPGGMQPLVRWITGLPLPIAYGVNEENGLVLFASAALRGLKQSRTGIHERALDNVRETLPPGFAPGEEPAILDGNAAALLVLPELLSPGEAWIAFPTGQGELVVMREGASSTESELRRLAKDRSETPLFERPVRVRHSGFSPSNWPKGATDRQTDPGFSDPRGDG